MIFLMPFAAWYPNDPEAVATQEINTGALSERTRRRVFVYMTKAPMILHYMTKTSDLYDGEVTQQTGAIVTDGSFFWREDLSHYVLKYGIELPQQFMTYGASREWVLGGLNADSLAQARRQALTILEGRTYFFDSKANS